MEILRRRAERVSKVSSSEVRTGDDKGTGGGGGGGGDELYTIDSTCWRGVDRVRIWSVVIA